MGDVGGATGKVEGATGKVEGGGDFFHCPRHRVPRPLNNKTKELLFLKILFTVGESRFLYGYVHKKYSALPK